MKAVAALLFYLKYSCLHQLVEMFASRLGGDVSRACQLRSGQRAPIHKDEQHTGACWVTEERRKSCEMRTGRHDFSEWLKLGRV